MSFFQSDVVRAEMVEISELQEEVYSNVFKFPRMTKEDQVYHISILERLLDKQRVLYTRLSLSDDPEAKSMKKQLQQSIEVMGFPKGTDMSILFHGMEQTIKALKQKIDA